MPCANGGMVTTDNVTKTADLLKLESFRPHEEIAIQSISQDQKDAVICTHIDYHSQHESAALIGLFHATSSVLTSVESYRNHRKPTQRGVQGYLSSLQRKVIYAKSGCSSPICQYLLKIVAVQQHTFSDCPHRLNMHRNLTNALLIIICSEVLWAVQVFSVKKVDIK